VPGLYLEPWLELEKLNGFDKTICTCDMLSLLEVNSVLNLFISCCEYAKHLFHIFHKVVILILGYWLSPYSQSEKSVFS